MCKCLEKTWIRNVNLEAECPPRGTDMVILYAGTAIGVPSSHKMCLECSRKPSCQVLLNPTPNGSCDVNNITTEKQEASFKKIKPGERNKIRVQCD